MSEEKEVKENNFVISDSVKPVCEDAEINTDDEKVSYGKFKDLKTLLEAYDNLQSEFTRRCQRIKESERETERLKKELTNCVSKDNAYVNEEKLVKEFLEIYPEAEKLIPLCAVQSGVNKLKNLERTYIDSLKEKISNIEENYNSNDFLLAKISNNQILKDTVIKEYLEKINSSKPIIKLISGGSGCVQAPPLKPKTISEAGLLAKKLLEKNKEI